MLGEGRLQARSAGLGPAAVQVEHPIRLTRRSGSETAKFLLMSLRDRGTTRGDAPGLAREIRRRLGPPPETPRERAPFDFVFEAPAGDLPSVVQSA